MYVLKRIRYSWHLLLYRHYQALLNDCISTELRNELTAKGNYHKERAFQYLEASANSINA